MAEVEQLKHRLAMVKDDLDIIRKFIYSEQLDKAFERQSETSDECWTNLNNISIFRCWKWMKKNLKEHILKVGLIGYVYELC